MKKLKKLTSFHLFPSPSRCGFSHLHFHYLTCIVSVTIISLCSLEYSQFLFCAETKWKMKSNFVKISEYAFFTSGFSLFSVHVMKWTFNFNPKKNLSHPTACPPVLLIYLLIQWPTVCLFKQKSIIKYIGKKEMN